MSENQPTDQQLPPEVIGDWELTAKDREILGIPEPDGELQSYNNPYAKLAEAGDDLLDNQDFYSKTTAENPYEKLANVDEAQLDAQDFYADQKTTTADEETTSEGRVLDFDPIGSDGTYVVKRTSGNMDDGWFPVSKEQVTDPKTGEKYWTTTVYKDTEEGRLSKTVRIDELRGWNAPVSKSGETDELNKADQVATEQTPEETEEESREEQEQNEAELKAGEILNFSEQLRVMIRESASENVTATQTALNKARAFFGQPRTKLLERRLARAQAKYDRKSAKQDSSRFSFRNKRHDLKAQKAYQELQESVEALDLRNNMLNAREASVIEKGENRREVVEQRKRSLMDKRIEAEARKQRRLEQKSRRQNKVSGESFQERERRIKSFTPEDEHRIRLLAIESLKRKN